MEHLLVKHPTADHRTVPGGVAGHMLRRFFDSLGRSRQRRALAALSDDLLRDIGLSRAEAKAENRKPFWRP